MKIYLPEAFNEIGGRQNNEDSIYPSLDHVNRHDRVFIVCDGMGGHGHGDVASRLVSEILAKFISAKVEEDSLLDIEWALKQASLLVFQKLKEHIDQNPSHYRMGSTMTLLILLKKATVAAWVGDSRIYQIRNGEVLFRSQDHSLVQEMIDMDLLTDEQAKAHPNRNIVTRSFNANDNQAPVIEYRILSAVKKNDFFLLCSDGLLEILDNEKINKWFLKNRSPSEIKHLIKQSQLDRIKDNYSMYLIKVKSVGFFNF